MVSKHKKSINKIAPVFALSACVGLVPAIPAQAGFFNDRNLTCVDLDRRMNTRNPYKKALYGIIAHAMQTSMGRLSLDIARKENIDVCYDYNLTHKNKCGMSFDGQLDNDKIKINPDKPNDLQARVIVHEARHGYHYEIGLRWDINRGNYSPAERMATYTAMEADARVVSIILRFLNS